MDIMQLVSLSLCLILSGVFSASETAITGSSLGKIQKLKSEGSKKAAIALKILKSKSDAISCMLIGNNIINVAVSSLMALVCINIYGEEGAIYGAFISSVLIIVFGEIIPKAIAVSFPESILLFVISFVSGLIAILLPITKFLNWLTQKLIYLFNFKSESMSSAEEVRGIIDHKHEEGAFIKSDRDMIGGVLDLSLVTVGEIMVHRSQMKSLDIGMSIEALISNSLNMQYSRIPLWQENKDNIVGVLYKKKLLKSLHAHNFDYSKIKLNEFVTDPWFIPENVLVKDQLHEFRKKRNHFAFVVNEYGDLQGFVTLEEILEEIVGPIEDEFDKNATHIQEKENGVYIIEGSATIRDINRQIELGLPDENASTLGGFIMNNLEKIPEQMDTLEYDKFVFTIISKDGPVIKEVKIEVKK